MFYIAPSSPGNFIFYIVAAQWKIFGSVLSECVLHLQSACMAWLFSLGMGQRRTWILIVVQHGGMHCCRREGGREGGGPHYLHSTLPKSSTCWARSQPFPWPMKRLNHLLPSKAAFITFFFCYVFFFFLMELDLNPNASWFCSKSDPFASLLNHEHPFLAKYETPCD